MKLIDNASKAWRMFSMQAMAVAAAIQGAWAVIPDEMKAEFPRNLVHWISFVLLLAGIVGRLLPQDEVH